MTQLAARSGEGGFRWLGDDIYKPQNQCKKKGKEGRRKDHGGNNEGDYTMHQSSSSHADHTNKVTDLCNLVSGQDTFTGGEVVFESDRRVSAVW